MNVKRYNFARECVDLTVYEYVSATDYDALAARVAAAEEVMNPDTDLEARNVIHHPGHDALWLWFGLSYASFLTLPRILMNAMSDEWQGKMAALLNEFDETFPGAYRLPSPTVTAVGADRRFTRWPAWLLQYRHPDLAQITKLREYDRLPGDSSNSAS